MAAPDTATVQQVLHRKVDVNPLRTAGDLDSVPQRRNSTMGPARPAILGDVLIEHGRAVVDAVLVAPGEVRGVRGRGHERVVGRGCGGVLVPHDPELLELLHAPDLAHPRGRLLQLLLLPLLRMAIPVHRAVHIISPLRHREIRRHRPRTRSLDGQSPVLHPGVPVLPPVLPPGVPDHPVLALLGVGAPAHHADDVVGDQAEALRDASCVLLQPHGIHLACDGATVVDLPHHRLLAHDHTVVSDGRVRVPVQSSAMLAFARPRDVLWGAGEIGGLAKPFLALSGARQVRVLGRVRETFTVLAQLVHKLIRSANGSSVARATPSAVQYMLDGQHHIWPSCLPRNLNSILERRHTPMRPTRPTILRDVLIQARRTVTHPVLVAPRELRGILRRLRQRVVRRGGARVSPQHDPELQRLLG
mmetsp:Transcript_96371/g.257781  ORF Transcript_96371/g.257781 Transcript_96371/m.257781 type:complete len:417 (-) Transcript_96371:144-1394(-)